MGREGIGGMRVNIIRWAVANVEIRTLAYTLLILRYCILYKKVVKKGVHDDDSGQV